VAAAISDGGLRRRSVPTPILLAHAVILRKELHGVAAGRQDS
jgi:hypothetical protein